MATSQSTTLVCPEFKLHGNFKDMREHRHGRLVAKEPVDRTRDGHVIWLCHCDCGNETRVQQNNLARPCGTQSCGCLGREAARKRAKGQEAWNHGKTYAIGHGEHIYSTRHSWGKAVIRAKGNRCQMCGWDKARCDVHHIIARRQGGKNTLGNGMVLCPNCHRMVEEGLCALPITL